MSKKSIQLPKKPEATRSTAPASSPQLALDAESTHLEETEETTEIEEEPLDSSGNVIGEDLDRISFEKVRYFVNAVLDDYDLNTKQIRLIWGVSRSTAANWQYLGLRTKKGLPQMGHINSVAKAHGVPSWVIVRCIEDRLAPPPLRDYSGLVTETISKLQMGAIEDPRKMKEIAEALLDLSNKLTEMQKSMATESVVS